MQELFIGHCLMSFLTIVISVAGYLLSLFSAGVVIIGVPWALFAIAHVRRTTDELLVVQREILRELRRAGKEPLADEPQRDDVARPPKQPFW